MIYAHLPLKISGHIFPPHNFFLLRARHNAPLHLAERRYMWEDEKEKRQEKHLTLSSFAVNLLSVLTLNISMLLMQKDVRIDILMMSLGNRKINKLWSYAGSFFSRPHEAQTAAEWLMHISSKKTQINSRINWIKDFFLFFSDRYCCLGIINIFIAWLNLNELKCA